MLCEDGAPIIHRWPTDSRSNQPLVSDPARAAGTHLRLGLVDKDPSDTASRYFGERYRLARAALINAEGSWLAARRSRTESMLQTIVLGIYST